MARWLQLASVAPDGTPRVRTLVFRGWADAACLDLLTDGRSAKVMDLAVHDAVELCWLLPRARCQFRLRGRLLRLPTEVEARERLRHWRQLTPEGRSLWGWPPPGQPLESTAVFPRELDDAEPIPDAFRLLRLELNQVELLDLVTHPHRRRRWRAATGWAEEPLNP